MARPPDPRDRVLMLAISNHHMRAGGDRNFARLDLGAHAPARKLGGRPARHCLDLRRDTRNDRDQPRIGIALRRCGVEPVNIGEQHEAIRRHQRGDARGQPVIIAIADFGGRHRVILVDHRHGLQFQQLAMVSRALR